MIKPRRTGSSSESGAERIERTERALTDRGTVDREHRGDVVVAPPALQHELENGSLIGRERVEVRHGAA